MARKPLTEMRNDGTLSEGTEYALLMANSGISELTQRIEKESTTNRIAEDRLQKLKADQQDLGKTQDELADLKQELRELRKDVNNNYDNTVNEKDFIKLINECSNTKDKLDDARLQLRTFGTQFDNMMRAMSVLLKKIDADNTAQNLAVTSSQNDEDYEATINTEFYG